jgi:hypothetical protein
VIDALGENDQVTLFTMNPDPLVLQIPYVKVTFATEESRVHLESGRAKRIP